MDARRFLNRYQDPLIAGPDGFAGRQGTFDINLVRAGYALDVSRISKPRRQRGQNRPPPPDKRRRRNKQDSFRIGATRGNFSTDSLVAVAAIVVGAYLILKK